MTRPRGFSWRRSGWIAWNTLQTAARQRVHYCLFAVAVGFVVATRWLRDFNFGESELKFIADIGLAAMGLFGAMLTIAATALLIFGEIEARTVQVLLAKPVSRAEFVVGNFLGIVGLNAVFCATLALVIGVTIGWRQHELGEAAGEAVRYASLGIAALLHAAKLSVLAAFTWLIASYARSALFTMVSGLLVFAIGHLQHLAHDTYARAGAAWERGAAALVSWVFPNFQLFALADSLAAADAPGAGDVGRVVAYALVYVVAAGGLAVVSFNRREL